MNVLLPIIQSTSATLIAPLRRAWLLFSAVIVLSGCTNSLVVVGDFPQPLAAKTDITMAVVYDKALTEYVYKEESESRARWLIDVGNIHKKFFGQVFQPLFAQSQALKSLQAAEGNSEIDLILVPKINEFQYSSPKETRINVYEVWIKYNMQVYNTDGELIADWIMSAYGKTPTAFLKSKEEAMNQAVIVALRDLGASLTSGFTKVPEIRAFLEGGN
ncbi:hypothetical protein [Halioxenophilus aromaticivorans]|uniref:ABC-type transport auxiliary lipoprotein component domain-containing protein n=1 Tax=Halioxenophilus aromaticivorans TaxID=1306992 RepID=A0AAV3U649_9ALTE